MLKLVHNLRCRSNFAKRVLLLGSSHQNSPKRPYFTKVGDFIGDLILSTNKSTFYRLAAPPLEKHFMEYISLCTTLYTACS